MSSLMYDSETDSGETAFVETDYSNSDWSDNQSEHSSANSCCNKAIGFILIIVAIACFAVVRFGEIDQIFQKQSPQRENESNNHQLHGDIFYLSAKFGFNDKFKSQVRNQRKKILDQTSIPKENVFTYFHLPEHIFNDPKWAQHTQFLRNETDVSKRGGGYWFWKSVLISEHLEAMKENDILVYSDADCVVNKDRIERFVNAMDKKKKDFVIEHTTWKEAMWTKADIYEHFYHGKVNQNNDKTGMYQAGGIQMARKTNWTIKFYDDWMKEMENWHLVSDEPSVIPNEPSFSENRHDQSMLSMLIKSKYHQKETAKVKFDAQCNVKRQYCVFLM